MTSRFAFALSEHPDAADAVAEVVGRILDGRAPDDDPPDLAVLFCSPHHITAFDDVTATVRTLLRPHRLVGTTASGIIGGRREAEDGPALSLWVADIGAVPEPVRLHVEQAEAGAALVGVPEPDADDPRTLLLLADPFTTPVSQMLDLLAAVDPPRPVVGGLASASTAPGGNRLVLDDRTYRDGAVGVLLSGTLTRPLVSQGCRPVGSPMIVTRATDFTIEELAGQPAVDRLREVARGLAPDDLALLDHAIHIGVVVDEHRTDFDRGDFLVRNVVGADTEQGTLTIASRAEVGTTVQFHVRDAASADEDLRTLLAAGPRAHGALVFTCNGRGRRLFDQPDHDAALVSDATTTEAVAGMFCAGEVGPVGSRSFLHGFTASVLLFG